MGVNETTIKTDSRQSDDRAQDRPAHAAGGAMSAVVSAGGLLPDRHPQGDFFICDLFDAIPKDDLATMEHPVFSLATRPDRRVLDYTHNGVRLTVTPSVKGLATIHDKDILIFCISQLMAALNAGREVSRTLHLKAHDLLVATNRETSGDAYRRLRDDYKRDELLVLAGANGWLWEEVYETVNRLNLEDHVAFLGRVPSEDLVNLYNAARLLVHPSFYEGFGLTPLEALTCGTPVIASNTAALPEIVGDAGLLIDPHDIEGLTVAMMRLLTEEELRSDHIQKGLKRAAVFSWQKAAEKTMDVYRKVANG